jgi:hypothetical protein
MKYTFPQTSEKGFGEMKGTLFTQVVTEIAGFPNQNLLI